MPDENLVKYIKDGLAQGRSEDVIRPLLVSNGWAQKDIDDAFVFVRTGQAVSPFASPQSASSPQITTPTGSIIGMSNHEGMRTRTKVILWILGVVVVLGAIGGVVWMIYGKTISSIITVQYLVRENGTLLNITLTPHVLAPITPATSTMFSYLGLTLSAPWAGVSSTKEEGTVAVQVSFTNGKQFLIMKASEPNPADVDSLYNALHVSTDYDLETAAFNAVPSQVSITTPGNEAILTTLLLTYKAVVLTPVNGSLYSFDTGTIKGFQHGDPIPGQWTLIEVYDQAGDKFTLSTMNATQGEIDYLLASVESSTSTPLTSVSSTQATATTTTVAETPSKSQVPTKTFAATLISEGYKEGTVPDDNPNGPTLSFYYPSTFMVQTTSAQSIAIDDKVPGDGDISFDSVANIGVSDVSDSLDQALQSMVLIGTNTAQSVPFSTASGLTGEEIQTTGTLFGNNVDYILIAIDSGRPSGFGSDFFITFSATYNYGGGSGHGTYAGDDVAAIKNIARSISL